MQKKYLGEFNYFLKQMVWNIGWLIYKFVLYSIFKSRILDLYYLNTREYEYARNYNYLSEQSESELTGHTEKNKVDFYLLEVQENLNIFFLILYVDKLKGHWES